MADCPLMGWNQLGRSLSLPIWWEITEVLPCRTRETPKDGGDLVEKLLDVAGQKRHRPS